MAIITKITTKDGSASFHNSVYDEEYHSRTGAVEEAFEKYAKPGGVAELALRQDTIRILDVCFGLGYNSAAAIDIARQANPDVRLMIVGLEIDPAILAEAAKLDAPFASFPLIRRACTAHHSAQGNVDVRILLGDARTTIRDVSEGFDLVFFDPFSPKKCAELWTQEFFREIFSRIRPGGRLLTYSCARVVRDNLRAAGFLVSDGPSVGRRGPSTIADRPVVQNI